MDVFHLPKFKKLKFIHHTSDTYPGFQWTSAFEFCKKVDSIITQLLEAMSIVGIAIQIKTEMFLLKFSKIKQYFCML